MKFQVAIKEDPEDGGYIAHCPALKGCWSQGDRIEEAIDNIKEAIVGYLKTLKEREVHDLKIRNNLWSDTWQWRKLWIDSRGTPQLSVTFIYNHTKHSIGWFTSE